MTLKHYIASISLALWELLLLHVNWFVQIDSPTLQPMQLRPRPLDQLTTQPVTLSYVTVLIHSTELLELWNNQIPILLQRPCRRDSQTATAALSLWHFQIKHDPLIDSLMNLSFHSPTSKTQFLEMRIVIQLMTESGMWRSCRRGFEEGLLWRATALWSSIHAFHHSSVNKRWIQCPDWFLL